MKTAVIFDHIEGKEVEINVFEHTGLSIGLQVRHGNEGQRAGSYGLIKLGVGEVQDVNFEGENAFGGQVFTAKVKWSNGETRTHVTTLLLLNQRS